MTRKRITGVGIGTPIASASLSWENVDLGNDSAHVLKKGYLVLRGGRLPKVRQVSDPLILGVHPSSRLTGLTSPEGEPVGERVPTYVPRDIDNELRNQLASSSFVTVVGDSSAGKSRAAFEALSVLGDHILIVPWNREALAVAIDKAPSLNRDDKVIPISAAAHYVATIIETGCVGQFALSPKKLREAAIRVCSFCICATFCRSRSLARIYLLADCSDFFPFDMDHVYLPPVAAR